MTNQIKITVIATGFEPGMEKLFEELDKEGGGDSEEEDREYEIPAFLRKR